MFRPLILGAVGGLLIVGCAGVLKATGGETRALNVHFQGTAYDREKLYVCGTLTTGVFSCVDYREHEKRVAKCE